MSNQKIIHDYKDLSKIVDFKNFNSFIVTSKRHLDSDVFNYISDNSKNITVFSNYKPNPTYENVCEALELYKSDKCDFIISLGGGSAIDVAKSLKAFIKLDENENFLKQKIIPNDILHLAIPTTAGTGSESTHFAVIYKDGVKYSVADASLIPDYVLLEAKFLESLPLYQKKSTMLDALCQGIESYWSVNATSESRKYAAQAIKLILKYYKEYIDGNKEVNLYMMEAANYSGRAINISKTTAAHALSYKLTSLYGISHGHAVALCLPHIWKYMINNIELTSDSRGVTYLEQTFSELDKLFECLTHDESIEKFYNIICQFDLQRTKLVKEEDVSLLVQSINLDRLKNNPVPLDSNTIEKVYRKLM